MLQLPFELLTYMLDFMSLKTINKLMKTCNMFYQIIIKSQYFKPMLQIIWKNDIQEIDQKAYTQYYIKATTGLPDVTKLAYVSPIRHRIFLNYPRVSKWYIEQRIYRQRQLTIDEMELYHLSNSNLFLS